MKNLVLMLTLVMFCSFAFSQKGNHVKNYQKGTKAANSGKYNEALNFLNLSIDEHPTADAYFNRAAVFFYLGDTCNFCKDLKNAENLHDWNAKDLYLEKCIYTRIDDNIPDSLKSKVPKIIGYEIVYNKCSSDSIVNIITENQQPVYSNTEPIFTIVESMPSFPGGEEARSRFLAENIVYPMEATNKGIQGTVYVSFVIDQEGNVTEVKILRGIGGGCDEESVRVVKLMPKWNPGKQTGKPVRVLFNMPIYYRLVGPGIPKK
jgi:TonB family protein